MALFKTVEELALFFPARLTFPIEVILPTMDMVEQEYLSELVLGDELYTALHTGFQEDTLDDDMEALLNKCRPIVANMAVYHFTGEANVELVAQGGLVVSKTEHKTPASEWRTRDLERSVLRKGYRGIDVLFAWLIENADVYTDWTDTTQYTDLIAGFVRSTQEFNAIVRIGNQGYLFQQMKPTIRRMELGPVKDVVCSTTLFDDLLAKTTAGTLSADEAKLVHLMRQATVHLAMAASIPELSLQKDERGLWTFSSLVGGATSVGMTAASEGRLNQRIKSENDLGAAFLDKLRIELQRQAEANPAHPYASSSCYVDPTATPADRINTDNPVAGFM